MRKSFYNPWARFSLACLLFLMGQFSVWGQARHQYNLLWKISGKQLSKPSYLFGTMHVKDKRVFDFSDSVLVKLDEAEGFAMEVTPDSIMKFIFQEEVNRRGKVKNLDLKKELTEEEYARLDERLQEKAGVSLKGLKNQSPALIISLLGREEDKPGDYRTFLDAHLYRLSKQQGKLVTGLENVADQLDIIGIDELKQMLQAPQPDNPNKAYTSQWESLVNLYYAGNAESLYNQLKIAGMTGEFEEKILTKRNINMTARVAALIQRHSFFIAVGAAHLAGDQGMVTLLRQKGYTVTPVAATFTGLAAQYKEKVLAQQWKNFAPAEGYLTVDMPEEPFPLDLGLGEKGSMYMYPDMGTGGFYFVMRMRLPSPITEANRDRVLDEMVSQMYRQQDGKQKLLTNENIRYQELNGKELTMRGKHREIYTRARMFARDNTVYLIGTGGAKETISSPNAERFLNSLRMIKPQAARWRDHLDSLGAFKFRAPVKFAPIEQERPYENGGKIKVRGGSGSDDIENVFYGYMFFTYPTGIYFINDELVLEQMKQNLMGKLNTKTVEEKAGVSPEKYPFRHLTAQNTEKGLLYQYRVFLRGARPVMMFTVSSLAAPAENTHEDFFNSLQFLDYKQQEWKEVANDSFQFALKAVMHNGAPSWEKEEGMNAWNSQSQASGNSFAIIVTEFSKYDHYASRDSLYNLMAERQAVGDTETDSIVYQKNIDFGGLPTREVIVGSKSNHTVKRIQMTLRGNWLYMLWAAMPARDTASVEANQFFNSLRFLGQAEPSSLFAPKTKLLLSDLASPDSAIREEAKTALRPYAFAVSDLPDLYAALEKNYVDDTLSYSSTRAILLNHVASFKDESTPAFVDKLYPTLPTKTQLALGTLEALARLETRPAIDILKKHLLQLPNGDEYYSSLLLNSNYDSLKTYRYFLPEVTQLIDHENYGLDAIKLVAQAYEDKLIGNDEYERARKSLVKKTNQLLAKKLVKDEYPPIRELRGAAALLGKFPDAECRGLLAKIAQRPEPYVAYEAVQALLENEQPVATAWLDKIAEEEGLFISLYETLAEHGQTVLFPKKLQRQELFAQHHLQLWLEEYAEVYAQDLTPVGEQEVDWKGQKMRVYLFKAVSEQEEEDGKTKKVEFGAISGSYSLDKTIMLPVKFLCNTSEEPLPKNKAALAEVVAALLAEAAEQEE
jgi:uncharacterized protein YbaP (TraB family)/HEAT repeat protein